MSWISTWSAAVGRRPPPVVTTSMSTLSAGGRQMLRTARVRSTPFRPHGTWPSRQAHARRTSSPT
eukprot:10223132-Heterocapsa_arctica.AAC.1